MNSLEPKRNDSHEPINSPEPAADKKIQLPLNLRLRHDATFNDFFGSAAMEVKAQSKSIFLWGGSGSGKSHLLQALCHQANRDGNSSIYLEDLPAHAPEILHALDNFSLICLDDIQQVIESRAWQIELFHLMNAVQNTGVRLLIASKVPAARLSCSLPDLASRLKAMVAVESIEAGDSDKLKILKHKAHLRGFELNNDVARFILGRAPRNMHHLIRLLDHLEVETLRQQKIVTIPFVKKTLQL